MDGEALRNTVRVLGNIQVLLSEGQFLGSHARGVAEAQSFVTSLLEQAQADLEESEHGQEGPYQDFGTE